MGLDMYLQAEKYASAYEFSEPEDKHIVDVVSDVVGLRPTPQSPAMTISINVAYWRKANAVHGWFVQHCGGGVDECQRIYVDREQLAGLRQTCAEILADGTKEKAAELLPPTPGFFFGAYDEDNWWGDWYLEDLRDTVAQLDKALALPPDWSFNYQASW